MEVFPNDSMRRDWDQFLQSFNGRYASITGQEETSMLARLLFDDFQLIHSDERTALSAFVDRI